MHLGSYLKRIAYHGDVAPTRVTLRALHRAHLLAIPYENLDIHLGRRLTLDSERIFEKLVREERGGWCYEMNGLFARVLASLDFDVRLVSGAVGRATRGDSVEGNHLVLIVTIGDEPWIADVGFGDGFLEPLPLVPGTYRQGFLEYRVEQKGERWIVHNHKYAGADSFDFTVTPRAMAHFAGRCHELQTSPESSFVQTTVCQRFVPDGLITLRGAVFRHITAQGVEQRVVNTAQEYEQVIADAFGIRTPGLTALFDKVWKRHLEWLATTEQA